MEKYEIIKKHIDKMDYYGLLSSGAPDDEFDSESAEIAARISNEMSPKKISKIIADIFNRAFGRCDEADCFLQVSEAITDDLNGKM